MLGFDFKRTLRLGLALTMTVSASSAQSLDVQVRIDSDINLRTTQGQSMERVGQLKAGSIVSIPIPDRYAVRVNGEVDVQQTLDRWMAARDANGPRLATFGNDRRDFFTPITVQSAAAGSTVPTGASAASPNFIALHYLKRAGRAFVVGQDAPVVRPRPHGEAMTLPAAPAARVQGGAAPRPSISAQVIRCTGDCGAQPSTLSTSGRETVRAVLAATSAMAPPPPPPPSRAARTESHTVSRTPVSPGQFTPQGLSSSNELRAFRECRRFIDDNGNYGDYGQIAFRELSRYPIFTNDDDGMTNSCPRYNSFSEEQRKHFWVWVYASLAAQESGCQANAISPASINPNGRAAGLLQMEQDPELRRGRDRAYRGNFCSGNIYDPGVNLRCSTRIMANLVGRGQGIIARNRSQYWGPFNGPKNNKAQRAVREYRACRN